MTARQRPASGSAAAVVPAQPANGSANGEAAATFRWESWFTSATPDQRAAALALARQQGLLYFNQLPAVAHHAHPPAAPAAPAGVAPVLARLLAGKADQLPPLHDEPLTSADTQLDSLQREAVRRALATPDVFLLQGLPGTGKSRVVTEVIVQAARRGWRVLLLAPGPAAVDVVLERLAASPEVLPIRLLGPDEPAESLPRAVRPLTLSEQRRACCERASAGARQALAQAEETCAQRQREEAVWPDLLPLAQRHSELTGKLQARDQQLAAVAADVEREWSENLFQPREGEAPAEPRSTLFQPREGEAPAEPRSTPTAARQEPRPPEVWPTGAATGRIAAAVAQWRPRLEAARSAWQASQDALDAKLGAARAEFDAVETELKAVEARCQARERGKWWTLAYWSGGSALAQREALRTRRGQAEATLRELEQAGATQQAARAQLEGKALAEKQEASRVEAEARQNVLTAQQEELRARRAEVERAWDTRCAALEPPELRPAGHRLADVDAALARWKEQRGRDDAACQFARQWADYLDQAGAQLAPRLPALANVLAGPIAALAQGRDWPEASATPFDLLIIEDVEHLTEADLLRLAVHAPRLMLVSQALNDTALSTAGGKGPRSLHGLPPAVLCWPRLWQALADDLGRLPYAWHRDGDRLVCELGAVRAEEQRYLERESLADAPEIELHILNLPRCKPALARVSFPGQSAIHEATRFIHRELDELPIQPLGRTAWWQETADAWVLHLGPACDPSAETVELDCGIRLALIGAGQPYAGRAARLEFARAALPELAAAQRWVETKLHWRQRERAVLLQVPHRMYRPLAEVIGPLLFPGACLASLLAVRAATDEYFEFVPVPAPHRPEWPREGAGLEQDLATGRHGDRLPAELRAGLPRKGIVNYLEAQALVRRLEQWAQAPAELASNGKGAPAVLVLALYEAQAELLRQLAARSALLQARPFALEIAVPSQMRQRECDVLVLSLTRSHPHRSVPLGDDVADLVLALTRPRQRVLVFGDPGTLNKRSQWHGPLDHLDAPDAHAEAGRVTRLLRQVQAHAPAAR